MKALTRTLISRLLQVNLKQTTPITIDHHRNSLDFPFHQQQLKSHIWDVNIFFNNYSEEERERVTVGGKVGGELGERVEVHVAARAVGQD